jgi:hypothetical protein
MALVQLTNAVIAEIYNTYTAVNNPETSAFVQSGVAQRIQLLDDIFNQNGRIAHVPFWNDLSPDDEPNLSNDSESSSTPLNVAASEWKVRKLFLNQSYKAADLVQDLTKSNPMQQIKNRFGVYWQRQFQRHIIACLKGVLADNVANDSGDMVNDIAGTLNSDVGNDTLFSREAMVNAAFTSGDKFDDYDTIAVHSMVYARMVKNDDIEFIKPSAGTLLIPTFMGRRVVVDDQLPHTDAEGSGAGDDAATYTSILFGSGAIGYGMGTPSHPSWVKREEEEGNGGGTEKIGERQHWVIHPTGYDFLSSSIAGASPSRAELEEAAQWNRVIDRKNIPLAYLITNG